MLYVFVYLCGQTLRYLGHVKKFDDDGDDNNNNNDRRYVAIQFELCQELC